MNSLLYFLAAVCSVAEQVFPVTTEGVPPVVVDPEYEDDGPELIADVVEAVPAVVDADVDGEEIDGQMFAMPYGGYGGMPYGGMPYGGMPYGGMPYGGGSYGNHAMMNGGGYGMNSGNYNQGSNYANQSGWDRGYNNTVANNHNTGGHMGSHGQFHGNNMGSQGYRYRRLQEQNELGSPPFLARQDASYDGDVAQVLPADMFPPVDVPPPMKGGVPPPMEGGVPPLMEGGAQPPMEGGDEEIGGQGFFKKLAKWGYRPVYVGGGYGHYRPPYYGSCYGGCRPPYYGHHGGYYGYPTMYGGGYGYGSPYGGGYGGVYGGGHAGHVH